MEKQRTAVMREELSAWRESVGATMPAPNPDYDPDRAKERYGTVYKPHWDPSDPFMPRQ